MKYFILAILPVLSIPSVAQVDSSRTQTKDSVKYNFIIIESRYQNQFAFWGRDYNQKIPFLSTNLMYYFPSGIWISASNFSFLNDAIPQQFGLSLGYIKSITSKIDWHSSYTQFYVSGNSVPLAYKTQGYFQTTLGFDWGLLFSNFQLHTLINQHSDVFLTSYHSRYFVFNKLWFKKVKVSFEPKGSFTLGTHNFEYANGLVIAPGGGGVVQQSGANENQGAKIQLLNFDFTFPLKFTLGYFSIEPAWKYTLPVNANPDYATKGLHIFTFGVNYYIPIKR